MRQPLGANGFRAEIFAFDREAYMNTSEGENGNKIKNFNETEKTVGFQPQFS